MKKEICPHCEGDIEIRNPTGSCDHLYYPDACRVCRIREGRKRIALEIVMLKQRLGDLELYKTMHAMEEAVRSIGWELAEQLEKEKRI